METIRTASSGLLGLFRKAPAPMALNLTGLVVSLAAFMLIMTQLVYEHGYDKCYPEHEKIYRIDQSGDDPGTDMLLPAKTAMEFIDSSPQIEAGAVIPCNRFIMACNLPDDPDNTLNLDVATVTQAFPSVFGFDMVEGELNALHAPDNVLIPQSLARQLFEDEPAIGKPISMDAQYPPAGIYKIGGVYRDLPENAQIKNLVYMRIEDYLVERMNASYLCYVRINNPSGIDEILDRFNSSYDFSSVENLHKFKAIAVKDIYYSGTGNPELGVYTGNRAQGNILLAAAILTLLIGLFNFTNFYTAIIPDRVKSLNIKKVNGATTAELRMGIMTETALLGLAGWLFALLLLLAVTEPLFSSGIILTRLSFPEGMPLVLATFVIILTGSLLAGLYPGLYATSFHPGDVLKGNFGTSRRGSVIRKSIVILQYTISGALIAFVIFAYLQNRQMARADTGFAKDEIAELFVEGDFTEHLNAFITGMKSFPEVSGGSYSMDRFGAQDSYGNTKVPLPDGSSINCALVMCSTDFPEVMGIDIVEGTGFSDDEDLRSVLVSRVLRDRYGFKLGDKIDAVFGGETIKGFTEDVRISSWRTEGLPVCFAPFPVWNDFYIYVRFHKGYDAVTAVSHLRQAMKDTAPDTRYDIRFYDSIFNDLYAREIRFTTTIIIFCILAVFFSLVGIFGLVLFDQQYRRRDIAVRKVFGADDRSILEEGLRPYLIMTLIGFAISVPVAWLVSDWWVSQFGVRITLSWWVFAVVLIALLLLTYATVYISHFRTRRMKPVENLKHE